MKPIQENQEVIDPDEDTNDAIEKEDAAKSPDSFCLVHSLLLLSIILEERNQFPLLIILSIIAARIYPPLGAKYVHPEITATWIAVIVIFLISGFGLKVEEFTKALQRLYFNAFVQIFNFGFVSLSVFGVTRLLRETGAIHSSLIDGMIICSCLPMAINVVIVLTGAAGGDEAAAVFNTTFSNLVGIFLSPALILAYLGTSAEISLSQVFLKLSLRVVFPFAVGLGLRTVSIAVANATTRHKKKLKRTQEYFLLFIVYTVFCRTFEQGMDAKLNDILLTLLLQTFLLVSFMGISWVSLGSLGFRDEPKLRVMGLFGCCGKTIALGVPLIKLIYPDRGLYTLPLLIWHPMQLMIGSLLTGKLAEFIEEEEKRQKLLNEANDLSSNEKNDLALEQL